ncbi:MAG: hypothetical protein RL427_1093 [Bacteroidota bacterium]|jgi:hypothetical protein
MQKLNCTLLLFFCLAGWAQKPISFILGKATPPPAFSSSSLLLKPFSFTLSLNYKRAYLDYNALSVYIPATQLNDQYIKVSDRYFLTSTKTFSFYNFTGMKIDSFNPNGVSDFGSAIATGVLNLLFESN